MLKCENIASGQKFSKTIIFYREIPFSWTLEKFVKNKIFLMKHWKLQWSIKKMINDLKFNVKTNFCQESSFSYIDKFVIKKKLWEHENFDEMWRQWIMIRNFR